MYQVMHVGVEEKQKFFAIAREAFPGAADKLLGGLFLQLKKEGLPLLLLLKQHEEEVPGSKPLGDPGLLLFKRWVKRERLICSYDRSLWRVIRVVFKNHFGENFHKHVAPARHCRDWGLRYFFFFKKLLCLGFKEEDIKTAFRAVYFVFDTFLDLCQERQWRIPYYFAEVLEDKRFEIALKRCLADHGGVQNFKKACQSLLQRELDDFCKRAEVVFKLRVYFMSRGQLNLADRVACLVNEKKFDELESLLKEV